jgi:uncharacterized Tic20 family protein
MLSPFGLAIPIGGVVAILGTIQTWYTEKVKRKNVSFNGFHKGSNGFVIVIFAVALVACGFALFRLGRHAIVAAVAALLGVMIAVLGVLDLADISNRANTIVGGVKYGPGLPLVLLAGVIALGGALGTLAKK